ncbi:winged helix-turn-helix transcriptional regulator [Falsiroseomonas sp. HW251]|uniref:winged helix-turn-helix transcriptional regulator n=1 Tax=Falsiroseomonas sp. HW251 TaxID=3390998 RepID=UPI003D314D16
MEPGILADTTARPFRRRAPLPQDCPSPEDCPVQVTLDVIGGRWKPLALYHLHGGMRRFNELRRLMPGVTQRMLTATLRELERDGILHRQVFPEVPPRVEYRLTERGRSLRPVLEAMAHWGAQQAGPGPAAAAPR